MTLTRPGLICVEPRNTAEKAGNRYDGPISGDAVPSAGGQDNAGKARDERGSHQGAEHDAVDPNTREPGGLGIAAGRVQVPADRQVFDDDVDDDR